MCVFVVFLIHSQQINPKKKMSLSFFFLSIQITSSFLHSDNELFSFFLVLSKLCSQKLFIYFRFQCHSQEQPAEMQYLKQELTSQVAAQSSFNAHKFHFVFSSILFSIDHCCFGIKTQPHCVYFLCILLGYFLPSFFIIKQWMLNEFWAVCRDFFIVYI